MSLPLPRRCFISHAYADAPARDRLIRKLADAVEPVVFPPIVVRPDAFVSDRLIDALLDCDGLVYLTGGQSARSFWVALERDFALRAGKPVFAADPATLEVARDHAAPLDLAAFASYAHGDAARVRAIADHLNRQRHFDLWLDVDELAASDDWQSHASRSLQDRLQRGGYQVVFWSHHASASDWVNRELEVATRKTEDFNDRVLFACLDDSALPAAWTRFHEPSVQLHGDGERSATQRLDDLVVRLYWLIYRKTRVAP